MAAYALDLDSTRLLHLHQDGVEVGYTRSAPSPACIPLLTIFSGVRPVADVPVAKLLIDCPGVFVKRW